MSRRQRTILVVAAHPDDEVLGMGGTIARHVADGDTVHILFLGDGVTSRGEDDSAASARRKEAARRASEILSARIVSFEDLPDNRFDNVPLLEIVQRVERVKHQVGPDLVYTHHGGDLNIDHRLTCQAVLTAFRPKPGERCSEIYSFEVRSATEWSAPSVAPPFLPDTYVNISSYVDKLVAACQCYADEFYEAPHTRSLEAIRTAAVNRGYEVGVEAAEVFMTLRRIIK